MDVVERWIDDNKLIQNRLERLEVQADFIRQSLTRIEMKLGETQ